MGYRIVCGLCGAEWEYTISKPKDLIFGGAIAALGRVAKITGVNGNILLELRKSFRRIS